MALWESEEGHGMYQISQYSSCIVAMVLSFDHFIFCEEHVKLITIIVHEDEALVTGIMCGGECVGRGECACLMCVEGNVCVGRDMFVRSVEGGWVAYLLGRRVSVRRSLQLWLIVRD